MAQQTAGRYRRTASQREEGRRMPERPAKSILEAAQKQFARTMSPGTPVRAMCTLGAVCALGFARLPGGLYPLAPAAFAACLLHAFCVPAAFIGCLLSALIGFSLEQYLHWWQLSACAAIWLTVPCWRRKEGTLWWSMLACGIACAIPAPLLGVQSLSRAVVSLANTAVTVAMVPVFERVLLWILNRRRAVERDDALCLTLTFCGVIIGLWQMGGAGRWLCGAVCALAVTLLSRLRPGSGSVIVTAAIWGGIMRLCGSTLALPALFGGALLCTLPGLPAYRYRTALFIPGAIVGGIAMMENALELIEIIPIVLGGTVGVTVRQSALEAIGRLAQGDAKEKLQESAASVRTAVTLRMWSRCMKDMAESLPQLACDLEDTTQAEQLAQCLCEDCERKRECWNDRFEITRRYMFKLLEAAEGAEPASVVEQAKLLGCVNIEKLEQILIKRRCQSTLMKEEEARCQERRTLNAIQLQGTADVLASLSERFFTHIKPDDAAFRRAQDELARRESEASVLYAVEVKGRKEIMLIRSGNATAEEMQRVADIACGVPMQPSAYETLAQTEVLFEQAARLEIDFYAACRRKDGENVAGDGYIARPLSGGRYLLALSDGMGSGEQAHRESQATLHLLWQCLCAGYTRSQALLAVNGILLSCAGAEMFATMDLCLIDLHTGEAAFEKLGACTSYVIRGGECKAICADTLPMGMLTRVEPRSLRMHLLEGDLLVMVSDGVMDYYPEGEAGLQRTLAKQHNAQPRVLCEAILNRTLRSNGQSAQDDMTVLCARVQTSQTGW